MWDSEFENPFIRALSRVVATHGGKAAIETSGGRSLCYRELWDAAVAMSGTMRSHGIADGFCVAVVFPRSPEFVTALIACWMCGAVALLLDADLPPARRRRILLQVRPHFVLDRHGCRPSPFPNETAFPARQAPAYLIYTSGSTGSPKGVLVSHTGLMPVLQAQIETFEVDDDSRCLWVHGTGFDASLSDIGTALLAGATLCMEEEPLRDLAVLDRWGITHVDLPPALLPWLDERAHLHTIVIGGEVCPAAVVRRWAERTNLVCVYGPTEATICTSMIRCGPDWDRPWIGTPLPGVTYSVHATDGSEASTGELWISGSAVALGYPWEAELTAERFVNGGRTFRTGDLVRRHGRDAYEFLGRLDRQFKLNGRLICPEEIEMALLETGLVQRARVLRCGRGTHAALGASVESSVGSDMLAARLGQRLPSWMVPTCWDTTQAIPETANGKPDDASIRERLAWRETCEAEPTDGDERVICRLMAECLQRTKVAAHEDFFTDLGGDSLAVVAFTSLATGAGLEITPEALSLGRTASGVAAMMRAHTTEARAPHEFAADVELPWTFPRQQSEAPRRLLLTGATGFLGSILSTTLDGEVLPLSRANGDVGRPFFGWDEADWRTHADTVDTVVHLAADVRLFAPYSELARTQVAGTREVLRFCATGRPKTLHYASTLSVFVDADPRDTLCRESDGRRQVSCLYGGYAQSKWVAEQLVLRAMESGLRSGIHRLGLLAPCTRTGVRPRNDWFTLSLPGLLERSRDADPELAFDLTPVDYAARVMAWLISKCHEGIFHIAAPRPTTLRDLESTGLRPRRGHDSPVTELAASGKHRSLGVFKCTHTRFDRTRTEQALMGSGIVFPEIDNAYLRTCLQHAESGAQ
jgi:acyl-CoA synthetase (AMP-forming)/AMP-acid ligase II/nucleoside-diphosphate-sugar epimerase